jgi:hypothetical protein
MIINAFDIYCFFLDVTTGSAAQVSQTVTQGSRGTGPYPLCRGRCHVTPRKGSGRSVALVLWNSATKQQCTQDHLWLHNYARFHSSEDALGLLSSTS